ncbi:FAD-dependent monooxygenase [Chondromyces crocatus]|uniref:FAD-binding domain-containing protein n=1 Tax=Chondromyces crocatus TaxID=52 RepID=A0A0K1EE22_CHOCO|nr:FAD-dependent monooxygenase [Chondromyces crocatus]AKT38833.1 uncharacterized protein CMC5_029790 [Chondromyces crocatus]
MKRVEVDVAIAGGGPVGLMLACELSLAGVKVSVFERREARVKQSRALTLHPRSLEILALRGIAERFMARGRPLPSAHYAALDTRLDLAALDTTFGWTLILPQTLTEELLEARALELGVGIHRAHRVTGLQQDDEGVSIEGSCPEGAFHARSRFAVGADGARSAVRTLAEIPFPGTEATMSVLLGDVVLSEPPSAPAVVRVGAEGTLLMMPLGDGVHHRIVVCDPDRLRVPLSEPVTLEELSVATRKVMGSDYGMKSPFWLSRFGNETRIASTYRQGRVFLAGDAAHIHLPAGGQGLNVGLQDAMNLGWKLCGVLQGLAPASLLDTYHRERHPVGQRLIQDTLSQSALFFGFHREGLALREVVARLLRVPEANRVLAEQIAALDVAYPEAVLPAPPGMEAPPELVGRRLRDLPLPSGDGTRRSLYELLHDGKWLLIRRPGAPTATSRAPRAELPGAWARWTSVVVADLPGEPAALRGGSAVLIRPDGRIGFVAR